MGEGRAKKEKGKGAAKKGEGAANGAPDRLAAGRKDSLG